MIKKGLFVIALSCLHMPIANACSVMITGEPPKAQNLKIGTVSIDNVTMGVYNSDHIDAQRTTRHYSSRYKKGLDATKLTELILMPAHINTAYGKFAKNWTLIPKNWIHGSSGYSRGSFQRGDCSMQHEGIPTIFYEPKKNSPNYYHIKLSSTQSLQEARNEAQRYFPNTHKGLKSVFDYFNFCCDRLAFTVIDKNSFSYNEKNRSSITMTIKYLDKHTIQYAQKDGNYTQRGYAYFNPNDEHMTYWNVQMKLPKEQQHLEDTIINWLRQ